MTGRPLVLKLGGSLAESGHLKNIIRLVERARRRTIIVPGGGPFADSVRALQPQLNLTDAAAHRLALLAMHQMAIVIAGLSERFVTTEYLPELSISRTTGAIPVWLPYALQHHDATLPADWTVTSDALAARLAERLIEADVALVKSCPIAADATLEELAAQGIVDPVFPIVVTRARLAWRVYGAGEEALLADALRVTPTA